MNDLRAKAEDALGDITWLTSRGREVFLGRVESALRAERRAARAEVVGLLRRGTLRVQVDEFLAKYDEESSS